MKNYDDVIGMDASKLTVDAYIYKSGTPYVPMQ